MTSRIEIESGPIAGIETSIKVDGIEIGSKVRRATVDLRANEANVVYLEGVAGARIAVEGLVLDRTYDSDMIVKFLENVDVVALESAAMSKLDGLNSEIVSPMAAAMVVLMEWAKADGD